MKLSSKVTIIDLLVGFFPILAIIISLKYFPGSSFSIALSGYLLLGYIFLMFMTFLFIVFQQLRITVGMIISVIFLLIGEIYLIHITRGILYDIFLLIPVIILILTILGLSVLSKEG